MKKLPLFLVLALFAATPLLAQVQPQQAQVPADNPATPKTPQPGDAPPDKRGEKIPAPKTADKDDTYRQLKMFGDVFERVRADYVEPVQDEKLIEAAVNGMLTDLDPHSSYLNRDEFRDMQVQTRGEFGGLGIEVTLEKGLVKIVTPIDDTPASQAGLQSGDLIVALDDTPVMGMTLQDAVNKMRGAPGSSIKVKIVRGEKEPFDITLTRAVIKVQSVRSRIEDKIGYLRITGFTDQTQVGLDKAMSEIKTKLGANLQGWVLDLRNNPGGLLDAGVSVSDTFLDSGEIVSTRGRKTEDSERWNATPGDAAGGKPIVVLVNGGSASAAEIVAGALQDHHRAIVLGTKSFGKGSVQTVIPLSGHGAIRLTTARYYTPSGRSIQSEGIQPDILVEPAKVEKISEDGFIKEANLRGALKNDNPALSAIANILKKDEEKKKDEAAPKDAAAKPDESDLANKDYQLARALDLLKGLALYHGAMDETAAPAPAPAPAEKKN